MSCNRFLMGTGLGLVAGTALGMTLSPSRREIKRAAHRAVKNVNQVVTDAVDNIADAMGL